MNGMATLAAEETRMHSPPAQNPPPSPIRPSSQKTRVARGWPVTWVVQTLVPSTPSPNAMTWVKLGTRKPPGPAIGGRVVQVLVRIEQNADPALA